MMPMALDPFMIRTQSARATCSIIAIGLVLATTTTLADTTSAPPHQFVDAHIYRGWLAVRQLDCARCHGKNFNGSSGPSLLTAVITRSAEEFHNLVLQGVAERGMPPYGTVPLASDNIQGIHAYFLGLARGEISLGVLKPANPPNQ